MRDAAAIVTGAAIGAAAGYLFLTDEGRLVRRRLEPIAVELFGHAVLFYDASRRTGELLRHERESLRQRGGGSPPPRSSSR